LRGTRLGRAARRWCARGGAALVGLAMTSACGTSGHACLDLEVSPRLNYYDGQSHVLVLSLFPLENALGFRQASPGDLLRGDRPPGLIGAPLEITLQPGRDERVEENFPRDTRHLGLVADYYRAPGDPEGARKGIVEADCGWFGDPRAVLGPRDLQVE